MQGQGKPTRPLGLSTGSLCPPPLEAMAPFSLPAPQAQPCVLEESLQLSPNTGRPGGGCKPGASSGLLTEEWPELRVPAARFPGQGNEEVGARRGGLLSGCSAGPCLCFKNCACVPTAGALGVLLTATPLSDWSSSPGSGADLVPFCRHHTRLTSHL